MKSFMFRILMFTLFAVVCNEQIVSGQPQWPSDFQNLGASFFEFGAKAYDRPGDDSGFPILVDGVTNAVIYNSDDLTDLGGGAGAEVRFGSVGRRGQKWESRIFVTNWSEASNFTQPNLTTPLTADLSPDSVDIAYDSEVYSFEFNVKQTVLPGLSIIAGPRFISFNEDLEFSSDSLIPVPPFGDQEFDTENTIGTRNSMLGAQIGALINVPISRDIYINGFIRSGGYVNFVEMRTSAVTSLAEETNNTFRRNDHSFVGEVGGKVYFDVLPGILSFFGGYEATWFDGVALAPVQAQTLTPTEIITEETPFFHAVTFGAQYRRGANNRRR